MEFDDFNGPTRRGNPATMFIPLIPYGPTWSEAAATPFARCLAKDLKASGRFQDVRYFNDWSELAEHGGEFDLIVSGRLNEDTVTSSMLTYGLTIIGATPLYAYSVFMLPMTIMSREVEFEVQAHVANRPWEIAVSEQTRFEQGSYLANLWMLIDDDIRKYFQPCPDKLLQPVFLEFGQKLSTYQLDPRSRPVISGGAAIEANPVVGASSAAVGPEKMR